MSSADLLAAAKDEKADDVARLIKIAGVDINHRSDHGRGPLYWASRNGHIAAVKVLLAAGANVLQEQMCGWTPLHIAADKGHLHVVQALLAAGAEVDQATEDGCTPLYIAADKGHLHVVQALLAAGAKVDQAKPNGCTPFFIAGENNHLEVFEALLAAGAKVDQATKYGCTPLYISAWCGHLAVVQALLAAGAKVDQATKGGYTPLFMAARAGHLDVLKALLAAGAQANFAKNLHNYDKVMATLHRTGHMPRSSSLTGTAAPTVFGAAPGARRGTNTTITKDASWKWLTSLKSASGELELFLAANEAAIRPQLRDFCPESEDDIPWVHASVQVFTAVVASGSLQLLRELLVMFVTGILHGTNVHYGPMVEDHALASSDDIVCLVNAGVYTDNGQQRSFSDEQRGFVSGTVLVPYGQSVSEILRRFDATGSCYAIRVGQRADLEVHVRMFGDDHPVNATFECACDTESICDKMGYITYVTRDHGVGFSRIHVDSDREVFNLARHGAGQVVTFMAWDPTWPTGAEPEPELTPIERRLLWGLGSTTACSTTEQVQRDYCDYCMAAKKKKMKKN